MMVDCATSCSTQDRMMTSYVASHAADGGATEATSR